MGSINDWADKEARLTANASPQSQSSSTRTVVQEPDGRPPVLPNQQPVFPHKHASLPTPSPDGASPYTRQLTDPIPQDRVSFFPQAVLAEQARLHGSSPNSTTLPTSRLSAHIPARLTLEEPLSRSPATESSTSPDRTWWDINQVEPGTVLFSTGPVMSKPPPPNPDLVRRASTDQSNWVTPSGIPSTKVPPDTVSSQDRDVPQPGYAPESPSLVYTTGHPANTGSHTGYQMNYPPYSPNNPAFGPSSPRHPSFGASGAHAQGNTYPNPGSGHAYPAYRPGMPYGAYPAYQGGYPSSPPMGASFGPMAGGFPGAYSGASAPNGYNNTPPSNSYQGSPVAGGYSSPTGTYGMHFAPYGMVSAPPMYAPATYAHAPYGHPYLSPQGHTEEGSAGMWWFMPAASGAGTSNMQSGQVYGAQPQAQAYVQRFGSSQQPPPSQPIPGMLNTSSSNTQQPGPGGFSPTAHSPTIALSSVATGSVASPTSPHQMYASFASMGLQSPQPPAIRHPPSLVMPAGAQAPPQPSATPLSPVVHSPTRPTSTPKGRASAASKSGPGGSRVTSPATTRRPWHPNPPVARSDWVMWVGNVPSDATHDELWAFFNQDTTAREPIVTSGPGRTLLPPPTPVAVDGDGEHSHGVSSVFLISRSNCAFVNYEEEVYLTRAVSFFNGRSLRPHDSRCPRLVCRVRRKDDDLRAGVGGQRGLNMHARWIQEQERRAGVTDKDTGTETEDPATSPSTYLGPASSPEPSPPILAAVDEANNLLGNTADHLHAGRDGHLIHHSGSGSTNSSFLARNFPKRYFILKSLTQFDLNISVERGLWATQAHNESTLDRAYRTSKDVFLIFSANKSGEWFGYARMDGPIIGSQQAVSWESRGQPKSPTSPVVQRKPEAAEPIEPGQPGNNLLFSPSEHKFAASPAPITPGTSFPSVRTAGQASAPPELGEAHKQLTVPEHPDYPDHIRSTTGAAAAAVHANDFQLDHSAPHRAVRDAFGPSKEQDSHVDADGVVHRDTALTTDELERARGLSGSMDDSIGPIRETLAPSATPGEERAEGWGKPFKIRWIKTERLPFHRTRHLRNPWNSDREVKVSRDGTEVEPGVGQRLLDEWENVAESESPPAVTPSTAKQTNLPSRPGMQPSYGSAPQPSRGRPRQ